MKVSAAFGTFNLPINHATSPGEYRHHINAKLESVSSRNHILLRLFGMLRDESTELPYCSTFGGEIRRIKMEGEDNGFIAAHSVPTFAAFPSPDSDKICTETHISQNLENKIKPEKISLSDVVPGAFVLYNSLSQEVCENIIQMCEAQLKFGRFNAGKNNHGALQVLVSSSAADYIAKILEPFVDEEVLNVLQQNTATETIHPLQTYADNIRRTNFKFHGINRRWRCYRYEPGGVESFAAHIDCGFPPSALSSDGQILVWDARETKHPATSIQTDLTYGADVVSRLTILMYLNEDFEGGHTVFYEPVKDSSSEPKVLTSIQPKIGSMLVFPQAVGEEAAEYAKTFWPLHEGSAVVGELSRPKYVIRSDILSDRSQRCQ